MLPQLGGVGDAGIGNRCNKLVLEFGEITQAEMNFSFMS